MQMPKKEPGESRCKGPGAEAPTGIQGAGGAGGARRERLWAHRDAVVRPRKAVRNTCQAISCKLAHSKCSINRRYDYCCLQLDHFLPLFRGLREP